MSRVLPAVVYDALELSFLAFKATPSLERFWPEGLGMGEPQPGCLFGHARSLDGTLKGGSGGRRYGKCENALLAAGVTRSEFDQISTDQNGNMTWQRTARILKLTRGE
jgi:hypothetical protein